MKKPYTPRFLGWCKTYSQEVAEFRELIESNSADVELLKKEYQQLTGKKYRRHIEKRFIVKCKPLVEFCELDWDDKDYFSKEIMVDGAYEFEIYAYTRKKALDKFHCSIPISCLEHWDIEILCA